MRIEQFDPGTDEAQLRACYQMMVGAHQEDDPNAPVDTYGGFRGWWVYGSAGMPHQTWLATSDSGEPVGSYLLELPEQENQTIAFANLMVELTSRRRRIGTALVAHAAGQAERAGRTLLMAGARVDGPGAAFAAAIGARSTMRGARRVLDVGPALSSRLPALRAAAATRTAGYSLRRWSGPVPDDLVDDVCSLNTAMADAPREENVEPEEWDPPRLRAAETRRMAQGTRWYHLAAMHDASGGMAALTEVDVNPDIDGWAFQGNTVVLQPHRGLRLGLHIKVAMLDWLATTEPQVRRIITYNDVGNEHMIAVNDALGHEVTDYFDGFELDVTAARSLVPTA